MFLTGPEEQLFKDAEVGRLSMSLQEAAFIASGLASSQIVEYISKFDDITRNISDLIKGCDKREDAEAIFDWLWGKKADRYERGGNFKLPQVVESYLGETEKVGNCLGLTTLYNALSQAFDIPMKAIYLDNFMGFPHVFSLCPSDTDTIPIENIFPIGFDYDSHKNNPLTEIWGNIQLVADIYNSRANEEDNDEFRLKRDLLLSYAMQSENT